MIRPLIGPIIKEVNKEVFTGNKYFFFDVVKEATSNFIFGLMNFSYDSVNSLMSAKWKTFLPGK